MSVVAVDSVPVGTTAERLAEITAQLVRFPTIGTDRDALAQCVEWVCDHALAHAPHLHLRRFVAGDKPSVLLWTGDALPRVLFAGHLDVVKASDHFAFDLHRDTQGRLFGRGAADMKGPVAALLDILEMEALPGLGLLLTTDEESGGIHGTRHALARLEEPPEVALLPDGGANMRLVVEQKGVLRLHLSTAGVAAHGSRPWLGANALEQLSAGYMELRRRYPVPRSEEDWRISITLTEMRNVGNSANSVPERAKATLDVRYPAHPTRRRSGVHEGRAYAREIAHLLQPFSTTSRTLFHAPAFGLDLCSPWVARLQDVVRATRGHALPLTREAGASDARFFAAKHIPTLVFQPVCANWHAANEWVDLASLAEFRAICAGFARRALT